MTVIGRSQSADHSNWNEVQWDAESLGPWTAALEGADVVVHLAGKRVDCRPTKVNIDQLIASRVDTVRLVGKAIETLNKPPTAWIQLSSLAIFGDSGETVIDETTPIPETGPRQQVEVCHRWEEAFEQATSQIERTVLLRPGIAIGGDGDPASRQLAMLARFGLGGNVGSGRQWVSWVSAEDMFDVLFRSVADESMKGLYHLTSPNPVRNSELMNAYRKAVGRSFGLGTPGLITTVGAWLLGSDPGLALTGRRCVPTRLLAEGYHFKITDIDQAVAQAIQGKE